MRRAEGRWSALALAVASATSAPLAVAVASIPAVTAAVVAVAPIDAQEVSTGAASDQAADATAEVPNPFEGIETWSYDNGLVVYFKNVVGAEEVFFRATLPVGSREDPERLEGLAHFVEHMLHAGPDGVSGEAFRRMVEDRGGSRNASTNRDRTDYWLELPASEWRFGLEWFADLMLGHRFVDEGVDGERGAVILEGDLEPKTPLDYIGELLFEQDWVRPPGFWERELAIPTDYNSTIGSWESLTAAGTGDIQSFYDRWYGPQNITMAIFGPLDRDAVREIVDATFGSVEPFGETAKTHAPATPANRPRRSIDFEQRGGHGYSVRYVLPDATRDDWMWAMLLRDLAYEHLNDVLRHQRRAAYGVRSFLQRYRGHMALDIGGNFDPEQVDDAEAYINGFLADLAEGSVDAELFEELRRRVVAPLLLDNQEPSTLARWIVADLYRRDVLGAGFPDPVSFARSASPRELAAWMSSRLVEERRVETIDRPSPLWPLAEVVIVLLVAMLTFSALRRLLVRPLDVRELRYVRKILYGPLPALVGAATMLLFVVLAASVLFVVTRTVEWTVIERWDAYAVHLVWVCAVAAAFVTLALLPMAAVPRKILLLDDHWRIKYLSYRSRPLTYDEIGEARPTRVFSALADVRRWPCRVLHWNPFVKGVHLQAGRGSWFFHTRNDEELIAEIEARRGGDTA